MAVPTVEVAKRGQITLPKKLRDRNHIEEGQRYTCHDLGNGVLLLSPHPSRIDALCDELRDGLLSKGATLEEMLAELRRLREQNDR